MKKISILVPTYNEEENVLEISKAIIFELETNLANYDYELVFIDNCSTDLTRQILREMCEQNKQIKAIFNAKNFGQSNSPFYGLLQTTGDCTILLCADFQDPVQMLPQIVKQWENGYKIVSCIKNSSNENKLMYALRSLYYKAIKKMSSVEQIEHFTGFGLYDRSFIEILKKLKDPMPYLRGIVAEYGFSRVNIYYTQEKRKAGKSKNNLYSLYDLAMLSFTSYTKIGLRIAVILGFLIAVLSFVVALVYFVLKPYFLELVSAWFCTTFNWSFFYWFFATFFYWASWRIHLKFEFTHN